MSGAGARWRNVEAQLDNDTWLSLDQGGDAGALPSQRADWRQRSRKEQLGLVLQDDERADGRASSAICSVDGRATSNLYFGPKVTPQLEAELEFETDTGAIDTYRMRLSHAAGDSLIFTEECLSYRQPGFPSGREEQLGPGQKETLIGTTADGVDPTAATARVFRHLLNNCRVFHFHDTSSTSRVRNYGYVGDNKPLMPDAGNLAAVLYRLRSANPTSIAGSSRPSGRSPRSSSASSSSRPDREARTSS